MWKKTLQLVLLENVSWLGNKWTVVEVKTAYANNVLLRKWLAKIADKWVLNEVNAKEEKKEKQKKEGFEKFNQMIEQLNQEWGLYLEKTSSDNGRLYSKLDSKELAQKIQQDFWVEISEKNISLKDKIQYKWEYEVGLKYQWKTENIRLFVV